MKTLFAANEGRYLNMLLSILQVSGVHKSKEDILKPVGRLFTGYVVFYPFSNIHDVNDFVREEAGVP